MLTFDAAGDLWFVQTTSNISWGSTYSFVTKFSVSTAGISIIFREAISDTLGSVFQVPGQANIMLGGSFAPISSMQWSIVLYTLPYASTTMSGTLSELSLLYNGASYWTNNNKQLYIAMMDWTTAKVGG